MSLIQTPQWYLFTVNFDHVNDVDIAIHKSMVTDRAANGATIVAEPEAYRSRFGPGTMFASVLSINLQDLFVDVNDAHRLVDDGYIRSDQAHLLFKDGPFA